MASGRPRKPGITLGTTPVDWRVKAKSLAVWKIPETRRVANVDCETIDPKENMVNYGGECPKAR